MTATVATIVAASPATAAPTPKKGSQARGPQRGGPQPPHGRPPESSPRVTAQKAHKPAVRNGRWPSTTHARSVRKDLAQDSARVTAQKAHKPAVRNGVVLGTNLANPLLPKGPQIRGKQSHGKPSGCSSCKGNRPGHSPKGPQARGPRPPHGGPKGRPEPHRGHRSPRR